MRVRASGWATKLRPCSDDAARTPACVAPLLGGSQWRGAASKECTRAGALRRQRMPAGVAREASGTGASSSKTSTGVVPQVKNEI